MNDWTILEYDMQADVFVYLPDQWSPLNLEGKEKYDRDSLMDLQDDPLSKKKPENLPGVVVVKHSRNHVSLK
jgi:hypothetical protein